MCDRAQVSVERFRVRRVSLGEPAHSKEGVGVGRGPVGLGLGAHPTPLNANTVYRAFYQSIDATHEMGHFHFASLFSFFMHRHHSEH